MRILLDIKVELLEALEARLLRVDCESCVANRHEALLQGVQVEGPVAASLQESSHVPSHELFLLSDSTVDEHQSARPMSQHGVDLRVLLRKENGLVVFAQVGLS